MKKRSLTKPYYNEKVQSEILDREFTYSTINLGLQVNDDLWQHDKWIININKETFDYNTGIGHRVAKIGHNMKEDFRYCTHTRFKQDKESLEAVNKSFSNCSTPKAPTIDDVLYGLILDAQSADQNFYDWCDDFGYDTDSRKHFEIYESCIKTLEKVRRLGIDLDKASELFQDY